MDGDGDGDVTVSATAVSFARLEFSPPRQKDHHALKANVETDIPTDVWHAQIIKIIMNAAYVYCIVVMS